MNTEPVRVAVYLAAAISGVGTFFLTWSQTGDWKLAVGSGLLAVVVPIGGAEVARQHAYSPDTVQKLTGLPSSELDRRLASDGGQAGNTYLLVIAICVVVALLFDWGLLNRLID